MKISKLTDWLCQWSHQLDINDAEFSEALAQELGLMIIPVTREGINKVLALNSPTKDQ